MGITSALSTGLSGLAANQAELSVVGNNIANVNTVGFKSSNMDFKTEFSQNFSYGSAPDGTQGGTNPIQVGMGVQEGSITRNFAAGSDTVTGVESNLAIEGDGFFVLQGATRSYSRDGSFELNSQNQLVSSNGDHVQGFGVDSSFNIVPGTLQNITIPLGTLSLAEATTNIPLQGDLNADGVAPTQVAGLTMNQPLYVSDGAGGVTGTAPTGATLLSQLTDAGGNPLFPTGATLNLTGTLGTASSSTDPNAPGTRSVASQSLPITATTTLGDLLSFTTGSLGINTSAGANGPIATTPGASLIAGPAGAAELSINGNPGEANNIALDANSLTLNNGGTISTPFSWTQNSSADGESISTSTIAYDSLGTPVNANIVVSLLSKSDTGTTWQYYATSPNGTATGANTQTTIGTGTISFDNNGNYVGATTPTVTIDRSNTGATPNLTFSLDFSQLQSHTDGTSAINANPGQDTGGGAKEGVLTGYSIDGNGLIQGTFDSGLKRTLGQVALATFRNDQGLIDEGNNTFAEGSNSGAAVITTPGQGSAGQVAAGALEGSNVDLSSEFVQLISASTGFSASSRVITTSNQLLQDLLSSVR